ncbi:MAG TPA: hypothetical protein VFI56_06780 [Vicinamibacterales bacterium]|jgi:hypothetical protein|nr:hypothetical protein [Vicinamibacterales bacterium]
MPVERFAAGAPKLKLDPVLRFQRYRDLSQVAPAIRDVARDMLRLVETLAVPDVVFVKQPVDSVDRDALRLVGGPTFHGRCFQTHLADATEVVCFVCTIGPAVDARVAEMTESDELLEALFVETAGWLAIEDALRKFRARLTADLRPKGRRLSPRLAPGFMDWALTEQPGLFSVFAGAPLPVSLSEYCVMTPKKSVSGLFGVLQTT